MGEGGCPPADVILMRLNPDGDVVWESNSIDLGAVITCNAIIPAENGSYYFVGRRVINGQQYSYLACTEPDPANNAVTLLDPAFPSRFEMVSPRPNPFNSQTVIRYDMPLERKVTVQIFDLNGREIAQLQNGLQSAGSHQVVWDGINFVSGLYFCRLNAGDCSKTTRLLLIK